MSKTNTAWPTPTDYHALQQEINRTVAARPNYQATMDFHKSLEKTFKKGTHQVRQLAYWHWDDEQSSHVVETPLTYPNGHKVAVVITRTTTEEKVLVQATFNNPAAEGPTQKITDHVSQLFETHCHASTGPDTEPTHITYDISQNPARIVDTVNRVAQSAATMATILTMPE